MCLPATQQSRRARMLLCIGLFCLAFSTGLQDFHLVSKDFVHFLRGLLIGISITALCAACLAGRMRRNREI